MRIQRRSAREWFSSTAQSKRLSREDVCSSALVLNIWAVGLSYFYFFDNEAGSFKQLLDLSA